MNVLDALMEREDLDLHYLTEPVDKERLIQMIAGIFCVLLIALRLTTEL